jgi:hypothetical protein
MLLAATVACHYALQHVVDHLTARWRSRHLPVQEGPGERGHMWRRASSQDQAPYSTRGPVHRAPASVVDTW